MTDRITPLPPVRVKLTSSTIPRPGPDADARDWGYYFANVALQIDDRQRRTLVPRWHGFGAIAGMVALGISVGLLVWRLCIAFGGPCR